MTPNPECQSKRFNGLPRFGRPENNKYLKTPPRSGLKAIAEGGRFFLPPKRSPLRFVDNSPVTCRQGAAVLIAGKGWVLPMLAFPKAGMLRVGPVPAKAAALALHSARQRCRWHGPGRGTGSFRPTKELGKAARRQRRESGRLSGLVQAERSQRGLAGGACGDRCALFSILRPVESDERVTRFPTAQKHQRPFSGQKNGVSVDPDAEGPGHQSQSLPKGHPRARSSASLLLTVP